MKKLLGIAALILAFSPLAQAQNNGAKLSGHPDARNNQDGAKHMRHVKHHHVKHHYVTRHRHVVHAQ
jgi:hypothetical protein